MKNAGPSGIRTITGNEITLPKPITGACAFDNSCPGVTLHRYHLGSMVSAQLLRHANPAHIIYGKHCGCYENVLGKACPGFFAMIDPPRFNIGKLTVNAAYHQIYNMCRVLDDIGTYWMILCDDTPLAWNLFNQHNIVVWKHSNGTDLIITNYEQTEHAVPLTEIPYQPKQIIFSPKIKHSR